MILPVTGEIKPAHFCAIDVVQHTAELLASMFKGKHYCSSCGTMQFSDTVEIEIQDEYLPVILASFPFVKELNPILMQAIKM
jgi:hypothetical protein